MPLVNAEVAYGKVTQVTGTTVTNSGQSQTQTAAVTATVSGPLEVGKKVSVKMTFAEGDEVTLNGNKITLDDQHEYTLEDTFTLADFQKASDNAKTNVEHAYTFLITNDQETKKQVVTFQAAADGSVVLKDASGNELWSSTKKTEYEAGKVAVTIKYGTNVASLSGKVGASGSDLKDGDAVTLMVKTNTKLTRSMLDEAVKELLTKKGYKVVNYYTVQTLTGEKDDEKLYDFSKDVTGVTTIYAFVEKGTMQSEPEKEPEATEPSNPGSSTTKPADKDKDSTPKTGNTDLMGFVPLMTLLSLVGIVTLKKTI